MRATPPSARMSAGTRSSAITAQAPASSAILRLVGVGDVHDHAALEHLGEPALDAECRFLAHGTEFTEGLGKPQQKAGATVDGLLGWNLFVRVVRRGWNACSCTDAC